MLVTPSSRQRRWLAIGALLLAGCGGVAYAAQYLARAEYGIRLIDMSSAPDNCTTGRNCLYADSKRNLHYTGGMTLNRTAVADVAKTVADGEYLIAYTSLSATRNVTLPLASTGAGRVIVIADESGSASGSVKLRAIRSGSDTVNGSTSAVDVVSVAYGVAACTSDGSTKWRCLAASSGGGGGVADLQGAYDGGSLIALGANGEIIVQDASPSATNFMRFQTFGGGADVYVFGTSLFEAPAIAATSIGATNVTQHAFPSGTGALCSVDATQTLSNKTLSAPVLSGTATGTYTLGGTPTITAPVINGATSSGSTNIDLSGNSGAFKTTTGAVTVGPGAVTVSGDVTLSAGKSITGSSTSDISARHHVGLGTAPSCAVGTNALTGGAPSCSASGTAEAFVVTLTTGTSTNATYADVFTLTNAGGYTFPGGAVLTCNPADDATSEVETQYTFNRKPNWSCTTSVCKYRTGTTTGYAVSTTYKYGCTIRGW